MHFDLIQLIQQVSYIGLFAIVFAESGLFFGFFLPGDSLLFTAGILASQGILNEFILLPLLLIGAVLGDTIGYWTGKKLGGWLMRQKDSVFFKKKHLLKAQSFYEKHGVKTIVIARFIPVVRTFAPIAAGMAEMRYRTFLTFNIVGAFLWVLGMTLLGYFLGHLIPPDEIDKYLLPITGVIILVSVIPGVLHLIADAEEGEGFSPLFKAKIAMRKFGFFKNAD